MIEQRHMSKGERGLIEPGERHQRVLRRLRDFDKILIGIADVHRSNCKLRSRADHRALLDQYIVAFQLLDHFIEWAIGKEAEIKRSRRWSMRLDAGVEAGRVHVEFVVAESQRNAIVSVTLELHSENAGIEIDASIEISRGEHDVIDAFDHETGERAECGACIIAFTPR
jgi:hypothetical protein